MAEIRIGIVGCGNIAAPYLEGLLARPNTAVVGVTDADPVRAEALAAKHGLHAYPDLDAMLADDAVQLVVNLTIHHAHYPVSRACLEAGRHVYSEKPIALRHDEARALVELADARGLRLGASPFTFLGAAQQTALKRIRDGALGTVRLANAEVNWGRIETWHPNPAPFYDVGPLFDVGVYPLTLLTAVFGPARRVSAYGTTLHPDRRTRDGTPFRVGSPDYTVALLELDTGTVARLSANFYVHAKNKQGAGVEFHGDDGSLWLESWHDPGVRVEEAAFGEDYRPVPLLREDGPRGIEWSTGVAEMVGALLEDRPSRVTGAQAAHVVEILTATRTSAAEGRAVEIASGFEPPEPMEWAR